MKVNEILAWDYLVYGLVLGVLATCANVFSWGLIVEFLGMAFVIASAILWVCSAVRILIGVPYYSRQFGFTSGVVVGYWSVKLIVAM